MKHKWLKILAITAAVVLVVAYLFVMISNANIDVNSIVTTEYAVSYTIDENLSAQSIIVRDEELLSYSTDNVLYYTVDDGDTVSANSDVAYVFADEKSALSYKRAGEINKEIKVLEDLNSAGKSQSADYSAIEKDIRHNLLEYVESVNSCNFAQVSRLSDNILFNINQRQIITGEVTDFNSQIASLQSELLECESASRVLGTVTTENPGYFVSYTDGFENVYDYDSVKNMSVSQFDSEKKPQSISADVIGKIVSGPNWNVAVKLSADDTIVLNDANTSIKLSFPNASCYNIPARLVSLNQVSKDSESVAVFACNYMNSAISHLRNEAVEITVNSYSGLRISKDAIHDDYVKVEGENKTEKVQGVYVLKGNELVFKEIVIIYSASDFVIIDESPEEGKLKSGETVKLNDSVVVRGENLYNGKTIE